MTHTTWSAPRYTSQLSVYVDSTSRSPIAMTAPTTEP